MHRFSIFVSSLAVAASMMAGTRTTANGGATACQSVSDTTVGKCPRACDSVADTCCVADTVTAGNSLYPEAEGSRTQCLAFVTTPKGTVSGIMILIHDGDTIHGAIVNEFGVTFADFDYLITQDKVKVVSVAPMLDKWYIKPVISKDIRSLLHNIRNGKTSYTDEKYKIAYSVSAMDGTGKGEDSDDSGAEGNALKDDDGNPQP